MENPSKMETNELPEEKKQVIETIVFAAFLQGKEGNTSFADWYKRNEVLNMLSNQFATDRLALQSKEEEVTARTMELELRYAEIEHMKEQLKQMKINMGHLANGALGKIDADNARLQEQLKAKDEENERLKELLKRCNVALRRGMVNLTHVIVDEDNPTDSVTSDGTKVFTTCNGKIDSRGLCSECGTSSMTSSSYCGRLIEVKPTESQDELWKDLIDVYDVEDRKGYGYATLIKALSARFRIERI